MVVGAAVVGGAVVGGAVVVVGLGAPVVCGAVVAGRVVGGVAAVEVRGADGGAIWPAPVVLVVLGSATVVSAVPRLLSAPAAAAAVVGAGQVRSPHAGGWPWSPKP